MTLGEIATRLGLTLDSSLGEIEIYGAASLDEAGPEEIAFFADPRYVRALRQTKAGAVLVPTDFAGELTVPAILCPDPGAAFSAVVEWFTPAPVEWDPGIHPTAVVAEGVSIDSSASIQPCVVIEEGVSIGPGTVIGAHSYIGHGAKIGANAFFHAGVFISERSEIGDRVILHSGVVIGSDGFGYQFRDGRQVKIPQTGIVVVGDDVEIGANSTVDRARFGRTIIGEGAKLDNLVQIAHNVTVGPHSILCAHVGISGSTKLGSYVTLAGKVGVNGHIEIGEGAMVGAMSGVVRSIPAKQVCAGRPVMPMREYKRNYVQVRNLHKLYDRVAALEKELEIRKSFSPDSETPAEE